MGFVDAIRAGFSNYVNFSGRAVRSEYWYWLLFTMLAELVAAILDTAFSVRCMSVICTSTAPPRCRR